MHSPDPFLASALRALALTLNTLFLQTCSRAPALAPLLRATLALIDLGNRCSITLPQDGLDGAVSVAQVWGHLEGRTLALLAPLLRERVDLGEPAHRFRVAMTELVALEVAGRRPSDTDGGARPVASCEHGSARGTVAA